MPVLVLVVSSRETKPLQQHLWAEVFILEDEGVRIVDAPLVDKEDGCGTLAGVLGHAELYKLVGVLAICIDSLRQRRRRLIFCVVAHCDEISLEA